MQYLINYAWNLEKGGIKRGRERGGRGEEEVKTWSEEGGQG